MYKINTAVDLADLQLSAELVSRLCNLHDDATVPVGEVIQKSLGHYLAMRETISQREESVAQVYGLNPAEIQVFNLLVNHAYSNKEIASKLLCSEIAVKKHMGSIMLKLGLANRMQILLWFLSWTVPPAALTVKSRMLQVWLPSGNPLGTNGLPAARK